MDEGTGRSDTDVSPEEHFGGEPVAVGTWRAVHDVLAGLGPVQVRVSHSQVALRRASPRGAAVVYLWAPRRYLGARAAPVVVTVVLGRRDGSPRWKEVVHPSPRHWVHHLEVTDPAQVDAEVAAWLREAWGHAG
ncbi:DUF5655 domain-containing protein [Actinotalea fermentans]|uniref:DUF5655 domain-containing protein n=1 Tax=Actinotalea fermentans TaxID=43671 RepID=A0A511YUM1_9CELL|nr:DUF5655 domain-containing protein [Actinotalea fermentans]KGM15812.1 hypothetical protein N867_05325 [Actinotalea fermentans ATCC 43279 = JCM 9966 = DSM 3133]GEN78891.1 hypothetical protein AFE02nite_06250 [Actinotalea fermentans]